MVKLFPKSPVTHHVTHMLGPSALPRSPCDWHHYCSHTEACPSSLPRATEPGLHPNPASASTGPPVCLPVPLPQRKLWDVLWFTGMAQDVRRGL